VISDIVVSPFSQVDATAYPTTKGHTRQMSEFSVP